MVVYGKSCTCTKKMCSRPQVTVPIKIFPNISCSTTTTTFSPPSPSPRWSEVGQQQRVGLNNNSYNTFEGAYVLKETVQNFTLSLFTVEAIDDTVLDKGKALAALAALRHAKWFQVRLLFHLLRLLRGWSLTTPYSLCSSVIVGTFHFIHFH